MPKDREPAIPQLGMAGVAFASLLVALTLPPKAELESALLCFATALPLIVSGAFIRSTARHTEIVRIREALEEAWPLITAIGDLSAGIGLYWLFRCVSASGARLFLQLSLPLWLGIGLLDLVLQAVDNRFRRKRKPTNTESGSVDDEPRAAS
jgi:hypothetical protein